MQGDKNITDNKNVVPTQKLLNGLGETWNSIKNNTYIGKYSSKFTVKIDFKDLGEKIRGQAVGSKDIEFVKGSNSPDFTPQRGDIFVWRTNGGGHTGVVYDVDGDKVTILEAIGGSGSADERFNRDNEGTVGKGISRTAVYRKSGGALSGHAGWVGYFRPVIK